MIEEIAVKILGEHLAIVLTVGAAILSFFWLVKTIFEYMDKNDIK